MKSVWPSRLMNQSFFKKIFVGEKGRKMKEPEYTDLFHDIFSGDGLNKSNLVGTAGFEPATP